MPKTSLFRLIAAHVTAGLLFFLLFYLDTPRPYSNIVYFILLGLAACWLIKKDISGYKYSVDVNIKYTVIGIFIMLSAYLATRLGYYLSQADILPIAIDKNAWLSFAEPWQRINPILSVLGIIIIVIAVELFYRSYCLELLRPYLGDNGAIYISSLLSFARAVSLGPVTGIYDGALALVWGFIYLKGGLAAALITHLAWDILFIYITQ